MKYLVLETHTSYAIVLDEAGNFLMAANLGYSVGQSLQHVELMDSPAATHTAGRSNTRRVIAMVAAIAACLMFFLVSALQPQVYATVIMSINPKLQLDLNRDGGVVRVVGLNEEGKAIAKKMNMQRGEPVEVAVADITDNAIKDGYLKNNGEVQMLVETSDTQFYQQIEKTLEKSVKETIDDRVAAVHVKVDKKLPQPSPSPTPTMTPSDTHTATGGETPADTDDAKTAVVEDVPLSSPVPTPSPSTSVKAIDTSPSPSPSPKAHVGSPTPISTPAPTPIQTPTQTPIQTPPPTESDKGIFDGPTSPTPSTTPTFIPASPESTLPPLSPSPSPSISVEVTTTSTPPPTSTPRPGPPSTTPNDNSPWSNIWDDIAEI